MNEKFIPLSVPNFSGNEQKYVNDAVVSEWVSSGGSMVTRFENDIAAYTGMPGATACASGTAGLHLAMLVAGIAPGQEVITPALTFIAATNPIKYVGAQPVFIGCDETLCIDPNAIDKFCAEECTMQNGHLVNKTSGNTVTAIEVVHVFGNLADMDKIMATAKKYNLFVIEDATEALGCKWQSGQFAGRMAGTVGNVGVYSFNGNKIITTGSGGMLVSNHESWAARAKHLSTQAKTDEVQYTHDDVGYNYRLTNLQAALGIAQLEQLEGFIARKAEMYAMYKEQLNDKNGLRILPFRTDIRSNHWFFSLYLTDSAPIVRDVLHQKLAEHKIQTRTIWALINEQPPYANCQAFCLNTAQDMRKRVLNIPCSTNLANEDIARVCQTILSLTKS